MDYLKNHRGCGIRDGTFMANVTVMDETGPRT